MTQRSGRAGVAQNAPEDESRRPTPAPEEEPGPLGTGQERPDVSGDVEEQTPPQPEQTEEEKKAGEEARANAEFAQQFSNPSANVKAVVGDDSQTVLEELWNYRPGQIVAFAFQSEADRLAVAKVIREQRPTVTMSALKHDGSQEGIFLSITI